MGRTFKEIFSKKNKKLNGKIFSFAGGLILAPALIQGIFGFVKDNSVILGSVVSAESTPINFSITDVALIVSGIFTFMVLYNKISNSQVITDEKLSGEKESRMTAIQTLSIKMEEKFIHAKEVRDTHIAGVCSIYDNSMKEIRERQNRCDERLNQIGISNTSEHTRIFLKIEEVDKRFSENISELKDFIIQEISKIKDSIN